MPGNADPSRIFDDPALADRRGDATGRVALAFLALLVAAFAVAAVVLISLPPGLAQDPSPRTAASATPAATPRPTPTPPLTPPSTGGTPAPSASAGPSGTQLPGPTPSGGERPPASEGEIGQPLEVARDGRPVGRVTVVSFGPGAVPEVELPEGARIVVMEVRYTTAGGMDYDAADWVMVDAAGTRYPSLGAQAPEPALGSGSLGPGESVTGNVAFIRERRVPIDQLVLTDESGRPVVVVDRGSPS